MNEDYARVGNEKSRATLPTKAFILDRRKIFVGSFNWDPRSININTELGVIMDSENMGRSITEDMDEQLALHAYEVVLNEDGNLRWIDNSGSKIKFITHEPDTSWWKRFSTGLMGLLPIKNQL